VIRARDTRRARVRVMAGARRIGDNHAVASIGHVAIGMAAGRRFTWRDGAPRVLVAMLGFSALAMLPDADVLGFALGVPYGAPFGHRGALHSLAVAVAIGIAAAIVARARAPGARAVRLGVYVGLVVASHGLLDAMTDGGKGVALLWPFTAHRYFFAWRPIPVAPIGAGFLSMRGLRVAAIELVEFAPFFAYALFARRRRGA
jgi:inner membrane protein